MHPFYTPTLDRDADGRLHMNCMTLIAGKDAGGTGSVLVAHNEDDPGHIIVRHGYVPARTFAPGSTMPAEKGCAAIPQAERTLGFAWSQTTCAAGGLSTADTMLNERGVLVCSNSMGGSRESDDDATLVTDGGIGFNLRRAIAERAQTARDGVRVLIELIETWGYASSGRAYTIADRDEAFMIQLVRGRHYLGARIPDDAVAVMPNHYNLHTLHDCPEMFYPDDIITYAIERGWYAPAKPGDFSDFDFARAYQAEENWQNPRNVMRQKHGLSMLLGREWDERREGMPFCVRVDRPLTPQLAADILRTHYEGTPDDSERFGPGRSPHDTDVRRICTGTTIESVIADLSVPAPLTVLYTAHGRPCQLPYIALHPLLGVPAPLDTMGHPARALEQHLAADPAITQYTGTGFDRLRSFETLAELLYEDVHSGVTELIHDITRRSFDSHAELMREADALIAAGDDEAAYARIRKADDDAVNDAIARLEAHARDHFAAVDVHMDAPAAIDSAEPIRVAFACPGEPAAESLVFGVSHTNVHMRYARATPGSVNRTDDGLWHAAFAREAFSGYIAAPGTYEFALGGNTAAGGAFAGLVRIAFA